MMMLIMLLERSWSFNAALNRGKETTKMLSLSGIIEASPGSDDKKTDEMERGSAKLI
jgi:hypothetical protein